MLENRDPAAEYFACSESERACFEAGIKLGATYHQYVGTPVSMDNAEALEKAIEAGIKIQPFVADVKVKIDRSHLRPKISTYRYTSLKGEMLSVWVQIRYGSCVATCEMSYVKELDYALMRVISVSDV